MELCHSDLQSLISLLNWHESVSRVTEVCGKLRPGASSLSPNRSASWLAVQLSCCASSAFLLQLHSTARLRAVGPHGSSNLQNVLPRRVHRPDVPWRSAADLRTSFLDFFQGRGHTRVTPVPIVPANRDDNTYFINSGMMQFKPVFLGELAVAGQELVWHFSIVEGLLPCAFYSVLLFIDIWHICFTFLRIKNNGEFDGTVRGAHNCMYS